MIAIIDYGMGNVRSLSNAIDYIGYETLVTCNAGDIEDAEKIILPGVGAFGNAMASIREHGLDKVLSCEVIKRKKPILGICLGMQLMGRYSNEHGFHKGLGWLDARIVGFDTGMGFPIPHMGWNNIEYPNPYPLFEGLKEGERDYYFVHSYYVECNNPSDILATCDYGIRFPAAVMHENIIATQFHPEKSQDNGIQVLKNFLLWDP